MQGYICKEVEIDWKRIQTYLKTGNGNCPFCGSDDGVECQFVDIVENRALQEVGCNACGRDWTDVYILTAIDQDGASYEVSDERLTALKEIKRLFDNEIARQDLLEIGKMTPKLYDAVYKILEKALG